MDIVDWLVSAAGARIGTPPQIDQVSDIDVDEAPDVAPSTTQSVDPVRILVDYIDSKGNPTHRPFIPDHVTQSDNDWYIGGFCLLRHARRSFVLSRISGITTTDGEYLTAKQFFFERLGLDRTASDISIGEEQRRQAAYPNKLRALLRPSLALLVIAAQSDGDAHREEIDRILVFAEKELLMIDRAGHLPVPFSADLLDQLQLAIKSMVPDPTQVPTYVASIEKLPLADRSRFWRAFCDVINADGEVKPEERALLAMIEQIQLAK